MLENTLYAQHFLSAVCLALLHASGRRKPLGHRPDTALHMFPALQLLSGRAEVWDTQDCYILLYIGIR